jgi:hypothetical protein
MVVTTARIKVRVKGGAKNVHVICGLSLGIKPLYGICCVVGASLDQANNPNGLERSCQYDGFATSFKKFSRSSKPWQGESPTIPGYRDLYA